MNNKITFYYFIESLGDGDNVLRFFTTEEKRNKYTKAFEDADKYEYMAGTGEISFDVSGQTLNEELDLEPPMIGYRS